jgi:ribokinase
MPRVLNLGSINIDHVYRLDHFVRPGESLASTGYRRFPGGKGLNQSIALARAGAAVHHAGRIGRDGTWLKDRLAAEGVDVTEVHVVAEPTGHAIIQVDRQGENAIVLFGGANRGFTRNAPGRILARFGQGDWFLTQNEVNGVPAFLNGARAAGMKVAFNPAPVTAEVPAYPLADVDLFVLNETEAEALTGAVAPGRVRETMRKRYPAAATVLTLGAGGACYFDAETDLHCPAEEVQAIDTTAAGDTFIGFFLAELLATGDPERALAAGCRAAAVCVTRPGAADSIPSREQLRW